MVYIKGLIGTLLMSGILYAGWMYYSEKNNTEKMPERYNIIEELETKGASNFVLPNMDGTEFKMEQIQDKVIVLNFWATWCEPCVREYPSMVKLADHFKGELVFIAVSADEDKKDIDIFLKAFGKPKSNTYMLWDPDRKVANKFGVERLPETFILDKNKKLVRKVIGEEEWYDPRAIGYFQALIEGAPTAGQGE